jgi:hypothetical protein
MGDEITCTAVVPLAFFTRENVEMTEAFLDALIHEPGLGAGFLYLNGGNEWASEGETVAQRSGFTCIDAHDWPFYRMWNEGIERTQDIALVLNNDIVWDRGELQKLARRLAQTSGGVAVSYPRFEPDNRGLAGWCFAIRPDAFRNAGRIDERYQTWFGDDELALKLKQAGYTTMPVETQIWHRVTQTMKHRPGYQEAIFEDMRLFEKKWAVGVYG